MRSFPYLALLAALLLIPARAADFGEARWVWSSPVPQPAGVVFFRAGLAIPEDAAVTAAEIVVTADNLFALHVNGRAAGQGHADPNAWNKPLRFDVRSYLSPGWNVLAVQAANTVAGPAGLLVNLVVELSDGRRLALPGSAQWKCSTEESSNWAEPAFNDQAWSPALELGPHGMAPWGLVSPPDQVAVAGSTAPGTSRQPPQHFTWPGPLAFLADDCSLSREGSLTGSMHSLSVTIFNARDSKAFPEHDLPAPMKLGRKLMSLPATGPGAQPVALLDAGEGAIGSPSATFDGRHLLFSMAKAGDAFFHLYRVAATGGAPVQLTRGPFHDIDPVELPDGRIAFTSTRVGTFEEYHNPPSRALFTMEHDGGNIRLLTPTFIFDNEPEVLADGRILFIRSDNFFDRGKVETLLHAVHPDGTRGYTEFGLDLGPEYGNRLRAFYCGSPAPMPDGRVAFVTAAGIAVGRPGSDVGKIRQLRLEAGEVAALPDGRLLCTLAQPASVAQLLKPRGRVRRATTYSHIAVLDPDARDPEPVVVHDAGGGELHSPVSLAPRNVPPRIVPLVDPARIERPRPTGILYCQNARYTRNSTAGWENIRAVRVLAGRGLTLRSSHSYIVHAGSEVEELGTVPLAADGSFAVEVPADTAIAFQMVDAEGRSELNEMSWIYVRPGEVRGCVGCHAPRQGAPTDCPRPLDAFAAKPVRLDGGSAPVRFRGNNAAVTGLMELQFDRYREVAGIGRYSRTNHTGEVAAWMAALSGGDTSSRVPAAQHLGLWRDRSAVPALVSRLSDAAVEVRLAAAVALSACATREALPSLLRALGDEEPVVASAAAMALEQLTGRIGPWSAGDFDWTAAVHAASELLKSSSPLEAQRAAASLGHMGGPEAMAALREYVAKTREVNPFPQWRKTHHGDATRFNARDAVNPRPLQAAIRALGWLGDIEAVPLLVDTIHRNISPATGNLFAAEAAIEALGRIPSPEAGAALRDAFLRLPPYYDMARWYGDHDALIACHASPVHFYVMQALDARAETNLAAIVPALLRALPTDPDRALLPVSDDYEALAGRLVARSGRLRETVETCLALLGDPAAASSPEIARAVGDVHGAWAGTPDAALRAAQVLSAVCKDAVDAPRVMAALRRWSRQPVDIARVFDSGIPVVKQLPARHWVSFYLARTLGYIGDAATGPALRDLFAASASEAASGRPDPLGPGVHFLHNDLTPCWRAEVAWALGQLRERSAATLLLNTVADLEQAPDTRYASADALLRIGEADSLRKLIELASDYPETAIRHLVRDRAVAAPRPVAAQR